MTTLLDRYILAQVLRPLAIALLVALLVFLLARFIELMELILGADGALKVAFEILGYLLPRYLGMALPISLLFGVMVGFNAMSRSGEVDAMQAAGFGLARQVRPALALALVIVVITSTIYGYLRPYAQYAYQAVVYGVSQAAFHASVRAGVFAELGGVTFLIQGIGADGVSFERVFLYERQDGDASAIAARNGGLVRVSPTGPPVLRLYDGIRLTIDADTRPDAAAAADARSVVNGPGTGDGAGGADADQHPVAPAARGGAPPEVGVLTFEELRTTLGPEHARMFRPRGTHEREMTMPELWRRLDDPPEGVRRSDLLAELHGRVVRVLSIPLLPLLGAALALARYRSERLVGFAIGLVMLIVYEQVLDFGENTVETGVITAFVGLWLPFVAFALICAGLFARAAFIVPAVPAVGRRGGVWGVMRALGVRTRTEGEA